MVEWAATRNRICGFGERGSVTLDVEGWRPGSEAPTPSVSVDALVAGTADAVRLPARDARLDGADLRSFGGGELSNGPHRVRVGTAPETHLAFDGPATLGSSAAPWLRFPSPAPLAVGFRESLPPRPVVTVPATPSGLATAVTAAGRTHRTDGPERSHPGFRPRTPRVTFGRPSVPEGLAETGSDPTMTVPASVPSVLVAAPLAYYLGANLRVGGGPPRVRGEGLDHVFEPLPTFAEEVAEALRGLCRLDARLRSIPGESGRLPVDAVGDLESAPPARRLAAVLRSPPESLPQWPLSTYVNDDPTIGRYLPYLLDRLSLVHPARSSSLDPKALLKRSLDEFYRGETPNVEAVDPSLSDSRFHAWLGDGTPVDAYTLLGPETPRPRSGPGDDVRIDVVCNEPEMGSERGVADVYRRRLAADVNVRIHERLSTAELAAVFERSTDLVHFVGHCELGGMVCPDGTLAAADIDTCGAESFFLNACGSYYEGYDLVRRGATVGAVTLTAVLDEQAMTLGTAFAELLAAGFAFDRALSLARGEIIVGRDYVVVGDGTHRLRPPRGAPGVVHLEELDGAFTVRYDVTAPDEAGRRYRSPFDGREYLCGEPAVTTLGYDALVDLLDRLSVPVRYDGDLYWSDEVARVLTVGQQS